MIEFTALHVQALGPGTDPADFSDIGGSHGEGYDGVRTFLGVWKGRETVFILQDRGFKGGSCGSIHNTHIVEAVETAIRNRLPLILWIHTGGARLQEGVSAMHTSTRSISAISRASGYIPMIAVVAGTCAGLGAYLTTLCDFAIFIEGSSHVFMTGPKVIQSAIGKSMTKEELGGTRIHVRHTGIATHTAPNTDEARRTTAQLLSYYSDADIQNAKDTRDRPVQGILPSDPKATYDMRRLLDQLADPNSLLECSAGFAGNLLTFLGRIDNRTVGFVANQPKHLSGCLDVRSSSKLTRFIQICDAHDLPLIFVVDCPGFLPGEQQEHNGLVSQGGKAAHVLCSCTCPRVTLVVRRMIGGSFPVMNAKSLGAHYMMAWASADIAIMGREAARQIDAKHAPAETSLEELVAEGILDEIITPEDSRQALRRALEVARKQASEDELHKKRPILPM